MASTSIAFEYFVQLAIPHFDGHYDHWSILMENFLRLKEYWQVVEFGVQEPTTRVTLSMIEKVEMEFLKLNDLKAKNYLFQAIDRATLEIICCKETSKYIWDVIKKKYQGNVRAKLMLLQALQTKFKNLHMKPEGSTRVLVE
ncbi:hypothetical protein J1N35_025064 [Gossypium stocksii]|uniref:Retrovirus-related Pol polyprotein from transposon TNT 1-94 n=1 Tax=Gossypium stocksii TaxID=47602 RepID=A0A9D3ZXB4_9ROSI|nr:hypothetical protein J1N35_025064 [Gossypium stocksii]